MVLSQAVGASPYFFIIPAEAPGRFLPAAAAVD